MQSDGRIISFTRKSDTPDNQYQSQNAQDGEFEKKDRLWRWKKINGDEIVFKGHFPIQISFADNSRLELQYKDLRLHSPRDNLSHSLHFHYYSTNLKQGSGESISSVTLPVGEVINFLYDVQLLVGTQSN